MNPPTTITPQEFQLLQAYIQEESGIALDPEKSYLLESRLRRLLAEFECASYGDLYRKARENRNPLLRTRIVDAITTNETLWFRDSVPFSILSEVFLPAMAEELRAGRPKIRIWSAACSTGQEPYSIAIRIHEFCRWQGNGTIRPEQFEILATDISSDALAVGKLGAYDSLAMSRGMSDAVRQRYFRESGRYWVIDPELKKILDFRQFNLLGDFGALGLFDAIFCRNVAIYFSQPVKQRLFEKMHLALRRGGHFFLGTSESLSYYETPFKSREYNNHTYYEA